MAEEAREYPGVLFTKPMVDLPRTHQVTVPTPGTPVELETGFAGYGMFLSVTIRANKTNTGNIYVSPRWEPSDQPYVLAPGETVTLRANRIYWLGFVTIDADVADDGVSLIIMPPLVWRET